MARPKRVIKLVKVEIWFEMSGSEVVSFKAKLRESEEIVVDRTKLVYLAVDVENKSE